MSDFSSGAGRAHSADISVEEAQGLYRKNLEEWSGRLKMPTTDIEVFLRNGVDYEKIPPTDSPWRRDMLGVLKRALVPPPQWMMISGLYPEFDFSEGERRKRLRGLYRAVLLYVRRAFARRREELGKEGQAGSLHHNQLQAGSLHLNEGQAGSLHQNEDESVFWDPIAEVCRGLEIAPSKLSALCKEYSGNSLSQVIDCVRAERVKKMMRERIREFVKGWKARCATLEQQQPLTKTPRTQRSHEGEEEETWVVWGELKASRRWPEFCQNTWAMGLGFSNYRRMYRACLAVWRMTPHQMEMAIIGEALCEKGELREEKAEGDAEMPLVEVEGLIRGIYLYREDNRLGIAG